MRNLKESGGKTPVRGRVIYEWEDLLSAEDVAKQNQEEIAKYGIPPNAKIVSRQVTWSQGYNRYFQKELERQFKNVFPKVPMDPNTGDYLFTFEGKRAVLGGNGSGTIDGLAPYTIGAIKFYTDDLLTIVDPKSTPGERALAAIFTIIKPVKVVDNVWDIAKGISNSEKFTPINPGPLPEGIAETFRSATYTRSITQSETTLYRVYGGKVGELGSYWTRTKPNGPLQSVVESALDQN